MSYHHELPVPRPMSRLERQHFDAQNTVTGIRRRTHDTLIGEFAALNGIARTPRPFALSTLAAGGVSDAKDAWGAMYRFPAADHLTWFRNGAQAALVLSQPYAGSDVDRLHAYAAERGLALHMPPNPKASFWFPGWTLAIAITRPDFGPVRWLDDQVAFSWDGPVQ